jgi:predicted nucleic acid-binding protein
VQEEYNRDLDPETQTQWVRDDFYKFLGELFDRHGQLCVDLLIRGKTEKTDGFWLNIDRSKCLEKAIDNTEDKKLQAAERTAFRRIFARLDEAGREYLIALAQAYIHIEILNCDPYLQALVRDEFSEKEVFLDTNVLIAAVCSEDSKHDQALEMLDMMKTLGIKIEYSSRTEAEFSAFLRGSESNLNRIRTYPTMISSQVSDLLRDPFFQEYRTKPIMTWKEYRESVENRLRDTLKRFYKVELRQVDEKAYSVDQAAGFRELSEMIEEAASGVKSPLQSEHDAFSILLIRALRQAYDLHPHATGSQFWLLTFDKSLFRIDCAVTESNIGSRPASVLIETWLEMLLPFLSPEVANRQAAVLFADLFRSSFPESSLRIPPDQFFSILDDWIISGQVRNGNEAKTIASDMFVRQYVLTRAQTLKTEE